MGFDGIGAERDLLGIFFGVGADRQCHEVIVKVEEEIKKGNQVILNIYGHSRGGVTGLLLAKQLSGVDPALLEINLAMFDPVPGNLIATSTFDVFDLSFAQKTMDLRQCKPLKRVLALYAHHPNFAGILDPFFAPVFSLYPSSTDVEIDAVSGNHVTPQGILISKDNTQVVFTSMLYSSFIVFARVVNFLQQCGTEFDFKYKLTMRYDLRDDTTKRFETKTMNQLEKTLLEVYAEENKRLFSKSSKSSHSAEGLCIRTKSDSNNVLYLNRHHQQLFGEAENKATVRITVEKKYGPISLIKRAIVNYPTIWLFLKIAALSVGIASLVFFTGGFGAIPVIAGVAAKLGLLSIIAAAPLIGVAIALLKPVVQWGINKILYPYYKIRDIEPPKSNESTKVSSLALGKLSAGDSDARTVDLPAQQEIVIEQPEDDTNVLKAKQTEFQSVDDDSEDDDFVKPASSPT